MYINGIEKTWYRFAFKYIYTALTAEQAIWSAMRGNQDIARNLNAIFMNPKHRLHELYKKTLLQMDADGKIRIFSDCMPGIIDTDDVNNSVFTNIFTEGFSLGEILYDTIYSLLLYTAQQGPNSQYPIFEKIAIHLRDTDLIWELIVNDPRFEEIKNIGVSVVSSRPLTTNKAAEKPEWFKSYLERQIPKNIPFLHFDTGFAGSIPKWMGNQENGWNVASIKLIAANDRGNALKFFSTDADSEITHSLIVNLFEHNAHRLENIDSNIGRYAKIFKKLEELQIKTKELLIFSLMRRMKNPSTVFQELISIRENIARQTYNINNEEEEKRFKKMILTMEIESLRNWQKDSVKKEIIETSARQDPYGIIIEIYNYVMKELKKKLALPMPSDPSIYQQLRNIIHISDEIELDRFADILKKIDVTNEELINFSEYFNRGSIPYQITFRYSQNMPAFWLMYFAAQDYFEIRKEIGEELARGEHAEQEEILFEIFKDKLAQRLSQYLEEDKIENMLKNLQNNYWLISSDGYYKKVAPSFYNTDIPEERHYTNLINRENNLKLLTELAKKKPNVNKINKMLQDINIFDLDTDILELIEQHDNIKINNSRIIETLEELFKSKKIDNNKLENIINIINEFVEFSEEEIKILEEKIKNIYMNDKTIDVARWLFYLINRINLNVNIDYLEEDFNNYLEELAKRLNNIYKIREHNYFGTLSKYYNFDMEEFIMTKLFEMIQNYNMDEVQQLQYRKFIETLDDRVYSRYIKNYIINHIPKIFINAMKNKDSLMIRKIIKLFYYPMPEISHWNPIQFAVERLYKDTITNLDIDLLIFICEINEKFNLTDRISYYNGLFQILEKLLTTNKKPDEFVLQKLSEISNKDLENVLIRDYLSKELNFYISMQYYRSNLHFLYNIFFIINELNLNCEFSNSFIESIQKYIINDEINSITRLIRNLEEIPYSEKIVMQIKYHALKYLDAGLENMLLPAMYKYSGLDDYYKRLEYYLFVYKSFGTSTHERPIFSQALSKLHDYVQNAPEPERTETIRIIQYLETH